ncbi:putative Tannase/feruloyl esterase [Seiridium unicorne]|uniref:Carboxylic ester hydrolase n=1 Tax=Seiridium unicorne TaxID=138068 RepID=A0ABR2UT64_9PEZI
MSACSPATFSPSVFGAEIISLGATLVTNYSAIVDGLYRFGMPSVELINATFCNVTVTYTHPGQNDNIIVEAWLPTADNWNERFLAVGGAGWGAGRFDLAWLDMAGAIADGYATITTDAGLVSTTDPSGWALLSPGNVNLYALQNFASVSLEDEAKIGKSLIQSFYGKEPVYSYWNGCSQGGRQGLMLAQRYPTAYDGIAAASPAIYWNEFFSSLTPALGVTASWVNVSALAPRAATPEHAPGTLEEGLLNPGEHPYSCEFEAITNAAIATCDLLDGVTDGVISEVDLCLATFDPFQLVGTTINCTEKSEGVAQVSSAAALVTNATWHGVLTTDGKHWWHGLNPGANLIDFNGSPGVAATNCTDQGCVGIPGGLAPSWWQYFVAKNPNFDSSNLTHREFDALVHKGHQEYTSIIGTDDADLSAFRDVGGKMVTYHGLADELIPTKGSEQYYNSVGTLIPEVEDFYRYYQVPGMGHCGGGASGSPLNLFQQLRAWVENGTVPQSTPVTVTDLEGVVQNRISSEFSEAACT